LQFTPFSGNAVDWISFKHTFIQTQNTFTPIENISRIRSALRGEAVLAVSSLSFTAQSPEEIIEALGERFGRPELIVSQELAAVRSLPKLQTDFKDLNFISCKVHNLVTSLKHLDHQQYLYSPEIFNTILLKLTPLLRVLWTRYAIDHSQLPLSKIELLSQFLRYESNNHLRFSLVFHQNSPLNSDHNIHNHNKSSHDRKCHVLVTEVTDTCLFCNATHGITKCKNSCLFPLTKMFCFFKKIKFVLNV
jgi:hypothetical protein